MPETESAWEQLHYKKGTQAEKVREKGTKKRRNLSGMEAFQIDASDQRLGQKQQSEEKEQDQKLCTAIAHERVPIKVD